MIAPGPARPDGEADPVATSLRAQLRDALAENGRLRAELGSLEDTPADRLPYLMNIRAWLIRTGIWQTRVR